MAKIGYRKEKDIHIISPESLPQGDGFYAFKAAIDRSLKESDEGSDKIIIDLTRVGKRDYFPSSALFFILTRFTKRFGELRVAANNDLADKIASKTDSTKSLLEAANRSLYKAKELGRNNIVINGRPHK